MRGPDAGGSLPTPTERDSNSILLVYLSLLPDFLKDGGWAGDVAQGLCICLAMFKAPGSILCTKK